MKCVICFEKLKSHDDSLDGATNWSVRCITCKDSWVCGDCYHAWDCVTAETSGDVYQEMPCPICKKDNHYSWFVHRFCGYDCDEGWWDCIKKGYEDKPIWDILDRNMKL